MVKPGSCCALIRSPSKSNGKTVICDCAPVRLRALVIARAALHAATAATLGGLPGSRRHHEDLFDLVELDVFHDDLGQPEQPSP
jgi:hypothetical protein